MRNERYEWDVREEPCINNMYISYERCDMEISLFTFFQASLMPLHTQAQRLLQLFFVFTLTS